MAAYLATADRVRTMGTDGAQIFLELGLTSAWPSVRARALEIARTNARRVVPRYLAPDGIRDAWDFADALDLLVDAEPLAIDSAPLEAALQLRFRRFARDEDAYGIPLASTASLTDEQAFDLLLEAYTFERAAVRWPDRFPVRFGLADALRVAWRRPLATWAASGPAADRATESAYLATHVPLVLTEYGRHPLPRESTSRFVEFLAHEFPAYLQARDVEIVGESADVFRQLGRSERDDAQVCAAAMFLLRSQNADGSWGEWSTATSPYNAVHKTWAAVTGLVERMRGSDGPYAERIATILARVASDVPEETRATARRDSR
jgi:hypothetical protein